jgi:hypothetical protein
VPLSALLKFAAEDREVRNSDRQLLAICRPWLQSLLVKSDAKNPFLRINAGRAF